MYGTFSVHTSAIQEAQAQEQQTWLVDLWYFTL